MENTNNKEFEDLMTGLMEGNLNNEDCARLLELLEGNDLYRKKYKELSLQWSKMFVPYFESEKEKNYKELSRLLNINNRQSKTVRFRKSIQRVAAIIIIAVICASVYYFINNRITAFEKEPLFTETVVPAGSQVKIVLPDNTQVWLNSGSVLKYDQNYGKKDRKVFLLGEGYFEVQKDAECPFKVQTNYLDVNVLGTVFNLKAYHEDENVEVNLLEGKINVSKSGNEGINADLQPNQRLVFNKKNEKMLISEANAPKSASWTTGKFYFINSSLPDIMKEIQRKYNVQIIIRTEKMKNEIFSGSVDSNIPIDDLLRFVDVDKKYTWKRSGDTIVIRDK